MTELKSTPLGWAFLWFGTGALVIGIILAGINFSISLSKSIPMSAVEKADGFCRDRFIGPQEGCTHREHVLNTHSKACICERHENEQWVGYPIHLRCQHGLGEVADRPSILKPGPKEGIIVQCL